MFDVNLSSISPELRVVGALLKCLNVSIYLSAIAVPNSDVKNLPPADLIGIQIIDVLQSFRSEVHERRQEHLLRQVFDLCAVGDAGRI